MKYLSRRNRLLLAGILTFIGLAGNLSGYQSLVARIERHTLLTDLIKLEQISHSILFQQACFGGWRGELTRLKNNSGSQYQGSGFIKTKINDNTINLSFSFNLGFNELDQLAASLFQLWITGDEQNKLITAGHTGTNPLETVLYVKQLNAEPLSFKAELPGPYVLQPTGKNSFGLQSPSFLPSLTLPEMLNQFSILNYTKYPDCFTDQPAISDLSSLVNQYGQKYSYLFN